MRAFEPTKSRKQRHEFTLFTRLPEPESDDGSSRRFPIIARFHRCYVRVSNRPAASQNGGRHKGVDEGLRRAAGLRRERRNVVAAIFVNDADGGRFREIDQIGSR